MSILIALFRAGGVIFLSLILAALALGYVGVNYPETLEAMLGHASVFKDWITDNQTTGLEAKYNVWVKFLIQEQQFVFMFFVIVMRLVLLLLFQGLPTFVRWLITDR